MFNAPGMGGPSITQKTRMLHELQSRTLHGFADMATSTRGGLLNDFRCYPHPLEAMWLALRLANDAVVVYFRRRGDSGGGGPPARIAAIDPVQRIQEL